MKKFLKLAFAASTCSIAFTVGCNNPNFSAKRDFETTIDASGPTLVHASTFNGPIEVSQSPDKEVHLVAHITARGYTQEEADKTLDTLIPQINVSDSEVSIKADKSASSMFISHSVSYELQVPKGWPLKLETSNGKVTATDSDAKIEVTTSNGAIHITNASESVEATTSNGSVTIEKCEGTVRAESSNGAIKALDCKILGDSKLQTSNGAISVTLASGQPVKVDASTSNGSVTTQLDLDEASKSSRKLSGIAFADKDDSKKPSKLTLETSNGSIKIDSATSK